MLGLDACDQVRLTQFFQRLKFLMGKDWQLGSNKLFLKESVVWRKFYLFYLFSRYFIVWNWLV
jgi:hypothetical protein